MIQYMNDSGVPFKVTDVNTPGVHTKTSYHYAKGTNGDGLAVDLAGPVPSVKSPALRAIVDALTPVKSKFVEFLHPWNRADHADHIHIAVRKGTFLVPIGVAMPDPVDPGVTGPPNYDLSGTPCAISAVFDSNGNVKGYYIMTDDGSVAAIGNIPYLGRVH